MRRIALAVAVTGSLPLAAAFARPPAGDFTLGPDPTWVLEADVPEPSPPAARPSESEVLLEDHQVLLGQGPVVQYWRRVWQVNTGGGVQSSSDPEVEFDPSFEKLSLHHAILRRGGKTLDVLDPGSVQVIQAESERDQRMYNGRLTAIVFLRDVRSGDVLDVAWSLTGTNPIFGDRFAGDFDLAGAAPVRRLRHALLRPRERAAPRWLAHGTDIVPLELEQRGGFRVLVWQAVDARPPADDGDLPPGFEPYPFVEVSEFADWADVARWAVDLFRGAEDHAPELDKLVADLGGRSPTPEAAALEAVRFVQGEIRYLGIEMGVNSHAPHRPGDVLRWRYGDCKDKALLLSVLLGRLGHEAWPALVNTELRSELDHRLPSPYAFDHAIVKARIAGQLRWIDATLANQGGDLAHMAIPPDQRALVVSPETTALETIAAPPLREPATEIDERWQVEGALARLSVTATYRGHDADDMRDDLAERPVEDVAREYLNQYARYDSSIRVATALAVEDDRARNVLVTREAYELPVFARGTHDGLRAWLFDPQLKQPDTILRSLPLAVEHPVWLRQTIAVRTAPGSPLPSGRETVTGPASRFEVSQEREGPWTVHRFDYRSLADRVAPERTSDHLRALDDVAARLELDLAPPPQPSGEHAPRAALRVLWAALILAAVALIYLRWRRAPAA